LQVRVAELSGLQAALGQALGEAGEGGPRIHELLGQHARVRCVGCGISLTPDELEALALAPDSAASSPRLDRLRLGYCARNGCDSRFYQVTADSGMVPWANIFRRTRELLAGVPTETAAPSGAGPSPTTGSTDSQTAAPSRPRPTPSFDQQWRRMKWAAFGTVTTLVLLIWWWRNGHPIPGLASTPPDSTVEAAAGEPAANPSR
jgi:hypothetical protein